MENNNIPVIEKAQTELDLLIESGNAKGTALVGGLQKRLQSAVVTLLLLGIITVAVSIIFGIYITHSITRPVGQLKRAAHNLVEGRLSEVQIDYQSKDELGELSDDMRGLVSVLINVIRDESFLLKEMANGNFAVHSHCENSYIGDFMQLLLSMREINSKLSGTLFQISQASAEVASESELVASNAQTLAQGASEQAVSVEELSCTIGEISSQVDENAGNAEQANAEAAKVQASAQESSRYMADMLCAMEEIGGSSKEIIKIIKTIEDIAFQTNILALNAAVEAARAGAEGKGFSVVSREIRGLANQATAASKSTASLIENSFKTIENGKNIANKTADSLSEVVEGVERVTGSLNSITAASVRQAGAISQIMLNVNEISGVVQTNSATAEESAAASEELSSQALLLHHLSEQFKLKELPENRYGASFK